MPASLDETFHYLQSSAPGSFPINDAMDVCEVESPFPGCPVLFSPIDCCNVPDIDVSTFLVPSNSGCAPFPAAGSETSKPVFAEKNNGSARFTLPAVEPGPVLSFIQARHLWLDLFKSFHVDCVGRQNHLDSIVLLPTSLSSGETISRFVFDVRDDGKLPGCLRSGLSKPSDVFNNFLVVCKKDDWQSVDSLMRLIQSIVAFGTNRYFLSHVDELQHFGAILYRRVLFSTPKREDPTLNNVLMSLRVILVWLWMVLQYRKLKTVDYTSTPFGVREISFSSEHDEHGILFFDNSEDSTSTVQTTAFSSFCEYGGWCKCSTSSSASFDSRSAICLRCSSRYHVSCMVLRSQLNPPSLPRDSTSVFWSERYGGILCPSCVRDTSRCKHAVYDIDYDAALRRGFACNRQNAVVAFPSNC